MDYKETVPPKDFLAMQKKQRPSSKSGKIVVWLLLVLALIGATGTYYFYHKYSVLIQDPTVSSQKDLDKTLAAVEKLMMLPDGETPTMATILDKNKLADQAFFAKAENDDVLLAYTKSLQAILYRPSTNKIIKVAPIYFNTDVLSEDSVGDVAEMTVEEPAEASLRIAYYNGSATPNLSASTEQIVATNFPEYTTVTVENAAAQQYTENLVIDLSGSHAAEAAAIATTIEGNISALPEGEIAPDADILVISAK
ncbi:MAG: hypothetical protein CO030_05470 [Candidatus Magasanikbacteria bacterium CG_4_9_14_0_2_um_filter_42_11]|uniref:LytR/CpsA/Psr regulator C-terminal domain-containing protein n=1 Tax=Candidatus Magasanikbacteria bacterium CG_4_9_14_0_2_um_filter_42_11 TaxID=1974643 RepID=A0A2M8F882_9BACT|nr:MAG: hypothetical protein COU34_05010 [Candidatus Magasanikbacteria bacterium CG10_big_fil_rev_8_21_14_0_10_43_9]PIY92841.1 MAG: hypothetical protein COY70_01120 [Candidatus Magasanikbacteria bacterium CG_4_10_14_0_8_um_filter_42_12]PJC51944.1 MAG: hypothetical protein CO030_05470 [Candidatus Magasanikbacteria bacterium CG_4_9_14_0_2_um_filter_42_11]